MQNSEAFDKRLMAVFQGEAEERIQSLHSGLIILEKETDDEKRRAAIETIFREAHSLKSGARALNFLDMESICRTLENGFSLLKLKRLEPAQPLMDLLHKAADCLNDLLLNSPGEKTVDQKNKVRELVEKLEYVFEELKTSSTQKKSIHQDAQEHFTASSEVKYFPLTDSMRISKSKLDALLLQTEEMVGLKLTAQEHVKQLNALLEIILFKKREWQRLKIKNQNGNMDSANEFLNQLETKLSEIGKQTEQDTRTLSLMTDRLLEDVKYVAMIPCSATLDLFPKFVRDLSRDLGKEINFIVDGSEIEIDRRILDEMKDPLLHLVRNAIDHGIEFPENRVKKNKPAQGNLHLSIKQLSGGKVEILISDDGAGLNLEKVVHAALLEGIISKEESERLTDSEKLSLFFRSGISTSPLLNDISGRGLGLAIVKEKVEKLNGNLSFETEIDKGTVFRILIPTTIASFRGVLVQVECDFFIVPLTNVMQTIRIKSGDVKTFEGREAIELNHENVSLVWMNKVLKIVENNNVRKGTNEYLYLLVLSSGAKSIAFVVDEILGEQEVLEKKLGRPLLKIRNISSAAILGNGKVVPILNISDLIQSAIRLSDGGGSVTISQYEEKEEKNGRSILVVEDSITTRALLKTVLENSGYKVSTAVDGEDAWTQLKTQDFNVVVSDVQMPRMDGFGLTEKIRADQQLGKLPVILVTGLETREDKERGIQVGANAYIVKSTFDQGQLLDVLQRYL